MVVGGGVGSATQDYFVIQEAEQLSFRAKREKNYCNLIAFWSQSSRRSHFGRKMFN